MASFWAAALLMGLMASAFVLLPLFLQRGRFSEDRTSINVELYEQRLADLESQLVQGELTEKEFAPLRTELQRHLLSETGEESGTLAASAASVASGGIGMLPVTLALLVPLFAFFAYADFGLSWGALADLEVARELVANKSAGGRPTPDTVGKLARSMQQQPNNHEGWFTLARSYLELSEYEKAADVFGKLLVTFSGDAGLASYHAESLFLADGRQITPRVEAAIEKTLSLNPHDLTMLEIRGMDAFIKGDLQEALQNFRQALVTADGPRAKLIEQSIARVEAQTGEISGRTAGRVIQVLVEVADSVKASPESLVFIFAKALSGPPMPLAVQKLQVKGLPTLVRLDETMAMVKGMGLSDFNQVQVVARISSSGIANASPDDYEVKSATIDLTKPVQVVKLEIEKRIRDQ